MQCYQVHHDFKSHWRELKHYNLKVLFTNWLLGRMNERLAEDKSNSAGPRCNGKFRIRRPP